MSIRGGGGPSDTWMYAGPTHSARCDAMMTECMEPWPARSGACCTRRPACAACDFAAEAGLWCCVLRGTCWAAAAAHSSECRAVSTADACVAITKQLHSEPLTIPGQGGRLVGAALPIAPEAAERSMHVRRCF